MKENNKVNPLKYFNDNKAAAVKKVGGAMKDFKKSLKRFQGDVTGSQVVTPPTNTPRPRLSDVSAFAVDLNQNMEMRDKGVMNRGDRSAKAASMNSGLGTGRMAESIAGYNKKGGSVKRKRK
jgi:hypothetical protein